METFAQSRLRVPRFTRTVLMGLVLIGLSVSNVMSPAGASSKNVTIVKILATPKFGKILVSAHGYALYTYSLDTKNHSNCTGSCLASWPVVKVPKGVTPSAKGVTGLGVMVRSNGTRQATFHGKPLYLFTGDTKPGETSGQGVNNFSVAKVSPSTSTTTTVKSGGYGY